MLKKRFADAQTAFISQQASEGAPVAEVCRKAGIASPRFKIGAVQITGGFE